MAFAQWDPSLISWAIALGLNSLLAVAARFSRQKALTQAGILHAWILGVLVWGSLGWRGYSVVAAYFVAGTLVTKVGMVQKEAKGIAEKRGGARGPENVWGSAFTGAVCAVGFLFWPDPFWWLAYSASFAAKLADTTSSEIGKAYGQRTFLITTLQPVDAGTEGAVSLEGTVAGILVAGGLTMLSYWVGGAWTGLLQGGLWIGCCWLAAIAATTVESWMGVVIQPRFDWMTNELINGIQTTLAALFALLLGWISLSL
ncbi:MAG: TIGR00297 family protein [Synechococcaceae cyanobacterium SM2_3_2]|nr:TIGR00297 family protein [Synechococcaceae cyanobacterium SM2_3_2]